MIISTIAAVSKNGCIGNKGKIPWKYTSDLRWFKRLTVGHVLLMGRKTFEECGKLVNRKLIVLSRKQYDKTEDEGLYFANNIDNALEIASGIGAYRLFICGGSEIYKQTMNICDEIIITEIPEFVYGDAFFPEWPISPSRWLCIEEYFTKDNVIFRVFSRV